MGKGWIALDIDGTLVEGMGPIPLPVAQYLEKLHLAGWKVLFLTGRMFSFAERELSTIQFPYYVAVQNGADILYMPHKTVVEQRYLDEEILRQVEKAYRNEREGFLVYAGFTKGDFCYYKPDCFSPYFLSYLEKLQKLCQQPWQPVVSFDELSSFNFPLIKCLGLEKTVRHVEKSLQQVPGLEVVVIRDPVDPQLFIGLVTDSEATKGKALHRMLMKAGKKKTERVIAAGDDHNDMSMLREADVRIVMETAPPEILAEGDIIAASAGKMGILHALAKATGESV